MNADTSTDTSANTDTNTSADMLKWLFERQMMGMQLGLTRMHALLSDLGRPDQAFKTVLIAGTNGKGSTAAHLAHILWASGQRCGLFTSPHLTHFAERFVIDAQLPTLETITKALEQIRPYAEAREATFFEVLTALACVLFAEAGIQWAVMEVGLGGRYDATNALEPELSLITSIGLDHTELLGDTLADIAREKAGILRPNKTAIVAVSSQLQSIFERTGAECHFLDRDITWQCLSQDWGGSRVQLAIKQGEQNKQNEQNETLEFQTPMLGAYAAQNASLAVVAAKLLGCTASDIRAGTAQTRWAGRLEVVESSAFSASSVQRFVLDGAHNPDGMRALRETLQVLPKLSTTDTETAQTTETTQTVEPPRFPVLFGASAEKDLRGVLEQLLPLASRVVLCQAQHSPRALSSTALTEVFRRYAPQLSVQTALSPVQALEQLRSEPLVLVCGSLYLVGEVRPLLLEQSAESLETWQRWQ